MVELGHRHQQRVGGGGVEGGDVRLAYRPVHLEPLTKQDEGGIDLKKIADLLPGASGAELKACCTEAGMFALRERRVHVTQEDFEMAVAKVMKKDGDKNMSLKKLWK